MDWISPFIVYRINEEGKLEEVFHAEDLKKAKYWLTYIALPGDVLCKTPRHPKHSGVSKCPEYWSHKDCTGIPMTGEKAWKEYAKEKACLVEFPSEQIKSPSI